MNQMQTKQSRDANFIPDRRDDRSPARLLLIASEESFRKGFMQGPLADSQALEARCSSNLHDGLPQLVSEAIDLVLVSLEYSPAELSSFVSDARKLGFVGPILHVASSAEGKPSLSRRGYAAIRSTPLQRAKVQPGVTGDSSGPHRGRAEASSGDSEAVSNVPVGVRLTAKQRAVLMTVSEGLPNQEIARRLACSEGSVKAILQQLFHKMGVRKRAQLVRLALDTALLAPQPNYENAPKNAHHVSVRNSATERNAGQDDLPARMPHGDRQIRTGDFIIDVPEHRVWIRGEEARLTPLEFKLLTMFCEHPTELMHHDDLTKVLWNSRPTSRDSLRSLVQAVRGKVETAKEPKYIVTQLRCGYRFYPEPQHAQTRLARNKL